MQKKQNSIRKRRGRPRGVEDASAIEAAAFIEEYLQKNTLTKAKFARIHGLDGSTVSRSLAHAPPRWTPAFSHIYCIAKKESEKQGYLIQQDLERLMARYQLAPAWAKIRVGELLSAIDGLLSEIGGHADA